MAVETPPWFEGLARDSRDRPVPAETPWPDGQPALRELWPVYSVAVALGRACAICGHALTPGRPVYRAFAQSNAKNPRLRPDLAINEMGGAGHKSCMIYSAMACPFLIRPTPEKAKSQPGPKRGSRAAVIGFGDYALLRPVQPVADGQGCAFSYYPYLREEDLPFVMGADLADAYKQALDEDAEHIRLDEPQRRWTEPYSQEAEVVKITNDWVLTTSNTRMPIGMTRAFDVDCYVYALPAV